MRRVVPYVFAVLLSCASHAAPVPAPSPVAAVFPAEETCTYDPDTRRVVVCTSGVGTITPGDLPEPYARCPMHQEARYGGDYVVATFSVAETDRARGSRPDACCYAHCEPTAFETSSAAPAAPERLRAESAMVDLVVDGFGDAVVSLPLGASAKRPVMVAVHGFRGRADWTCRIARHIVENDAFVLCPRGTPAPAVASDGEWPRFTFARPDALQKEIEAGLAALARAYPGYVDESKLLFYGHSLGASYGVAMTARAPERWSRVVMSEGGWGGWWPTAKMRAAGQRVLFACGTTECLGGATASARALERGKVPARVVYSAGAGHHSFGPIVDAIESERAWLLGDKLE